MAQLNNSFLAVAVLATSTLLVGCNQSLNSIAPTAPPAALPSAPAEPVASGQLPPINGGQADATGRNQAARQAAANEQLASAPVTPEINNAAPVSEPTRSTSGSAKITREGMAGSWQVPTDGADCRIILAFTKWSGGYRAATRRCSSPEIQAINAWDVKDRTVVLVDQSGNEIARLFGANGGSYQGRTKSGQAISFTR